jgi:hypothetical protein
MKKSIEEEFKLKPVMPENKGKTMGWKKYTLQRIKQDIWRLEKKLGIQYDPSKTRF